MRQRQHRGILPQDQQTALPGEIYAQPEHVAGSLGLRPGPQAAPDPVSGPHARDDDRARALGPKRGRWLNPYRGIVFPFTVNTVSEPVVSGNSHRCYILIQNLDAAADMWLNFSNEAVVGSSVLLIPRGNYELIGGEKGGAFSPFDSVHVIGTVAAQRGIIVQGVPWWDD